MRTAFPETGGFDEQTTLICVHAPGGTSRRFESLLPRIARDRSVYAPDLPGCGESDSASEPDLLHCAPLALLDLTRELHLRSVDVFAIGAAVPIALAFAAANPAGVRRVALLAADASGAGTSGAGTSAQPQRWLRLEREISGDALESAPDFVARALREFLDAR